MGIGRLFIELDELVFLTHASDGLKVGALGVTRVSQSAEATQRFSPQVRTINVDNGSSLIQWCPDRISPGVKCVGCSENGWRIKYIFCKVLKSEPHKIAVPDTIGTLL